MQVTNTILGRMQTATTCNACGGAGETVDKRPNGADAQGMMVKGTVSIKT